MKWQQFENRGQICIFIWHTYLNFQKFKVLNTHTAFKGLTNILSFLKCILNDYYNLESAETTFSLVCLLTVIPNIRFRTHMECKISLDTIKIQETR